MKLLKNIDRTIHNYVELSNIAKYGKHYGQVIMSKRRESSRKLQTLKLKRMVDSRSVKSLI